MAAEFTIHDRFNPDIHGKIVGNKYFSNDGKLLFSETDVRHVGPVESIANNHQAKCIISLNTLAQFEITLPIYAYGQLERITAMRRANDHRALFERIAAAKGGTPQHRPTKPWMLLWLGIIPITAVCVTADASMGHTLTLGVLHGMLVGINFHKG